METGERFQRAFEDAAIGISLIAIEPLGKYLEVNPAFCRMTGYLREELLARDFQSITASQDLDQNLAQLRTLLSGNTPSLQLEKRYIRKDGNSFWARLHVSLVRDSDGKPLYLTVQIEDIDDRKRTEEESRELNAVLENAVEGISRMDVQGRYVSVNRAYASMVGYQPEEMIGMAWEPTVAPEDRERVAAAYQEMLAIGEGEAEVRAVRKDGTPFYKHVVMFKISDKEGRFRGHYCLMRDITERKRVEEALRESSQFNQQVIANAREGIIVYDRDLRYVVWNPFMEEMTGLRPEEVLGKQPPDLAALLQDHGKIITTKEVMDEIYASAKKALVGETFTYFDIPYTLKTGGMGWNLARWGPFRNSQGEIIGVIATVLDITERKQLEEQLRHAQKIEAIGHLTGGVAHEFNNLLTAIIGNLNLAIKQTAPGNDLQSILTRAEQAAHRGAMLTQQLLAFGRRSPVDLQPRGLGFISEEVVRLLRQTIDRRIQVTVEPAAGLWPVMADADQMHQVIMNLCVNARDAIMERLEKETDSPTPLSWQPLIGVKTDNVQIDEAFCRHHPDAKPGDYVCLTVFDNGCGMDQATQRHLFEPFFTTKEIGRGTGLGLPTVYGIVKQHEGWIELNSKKNQGTTFKIYLPRTQQSAAPGVEKVHDERVSRGSETILFVDDEAPIRRLGQTVLEHHGYTVLLAKDGLEALEIFRRERKHIGLVVLDLTMPRQSGREVLKQLLLLSPKVKVLVSSGHHRTSEAGELKGLGTVEFFPKPYRPDELARAVRRLLDRPHSQ